MAFHTYPDVNPFGSTAEDMRNMHARVAAVMSRAKKHLAKIPRPGSYWEEPAIHGSGRQVNLRGARGQLADVVRRAAPRKTTTRLPSLPRKHMSGAQSLLIGAGVAAVVGTVAWFITRNRRKAASSTAPQIAPAHVGSGYSVLLGDA